MNVLPQSSKRPQSNSHPQSSGQVFTPEQPVARKLAWSSEQDKRPQSSAKQKASNLQMSRAEQQLDIGILETPQSSTMILEISQSATERLLETQQNFADRLILEKTSIVKNRPERALSYEAINIQKYATSSERRLNARYKVSSKVQKRKISFDDDSFVAETPKKKIKHSPETKENQPESPEMKHSSEPSPQPTRNVELSPEQKQNVEMSPELKQSIEMSPEMKLVVCGFSFKLI